MTFLLAALGYLIVATFLGMVECVWCSPPHVLQEGSEPTSHGLCAVAEARLNAELDAMETAR